MVLFDNTESLFNNNIMLKRYLQSYLYLRKFYCPRVIVIDIYIINIYATLLKILKWNKRICFGVLVIFEVRL